MRFISIIIFFAFIIFSCNKNQEKLPVDKEKLVNILVDVHIAESAMQEYALQTKDSIGRAYYRKIFDLHQVKEADFNKSMYLVKQDPAELEALYKEVLAELERRERGE
ncbi:MAG: DUF4296 domain-containing protein [Saprospiraceae bacterium]